MAKGMGMLDVIQRLAQQERQRALEEKVERMSKELSKSVAMRENDTRLSTKEVAQLLRRHPKTIDRWTRTRGLPFKRDGRNLVFVLGDVLQWRAQQER